MFADLATKPRWYTQASKTIFGVALDVKDLGSNFTSTLF